MPPITSRTSLPAASPTSFSKARDAIGGTWDLFRYPGIRSDSDMFTLGYPFRPWTNARPSPTATRSAPTFATPRKLTASTATSASGIGSSARRGRPPDAAGPIEAERRAGREPVRFTCNFLFGCTGYYDYEDGYTPEFAGAADFTGRVVHPQQWPEDLDYEDKQVVVIGSGATAVTIIPAIAKTAAHVTMLQRSPTYIVSRPTEMRSPNGCAAICRPGLAYSALRAGTTCSSGFIFYNLSRRNPTR